MRRNLSWLLTVLCPLCLACGSSGSGTAASSTGDDSSADTTSSGGPTTTGGTTSSSSGTGGMMAGGIPGAGVSDQVDNDFTDVEPNNTPQQATPLGVAMSGSVNVWVGGNTIGGSDNPADYFVFESGPAAGQFSFDICFNAPTTAMTATLSKVVGGQAEMPPVGTWMSSATCVTTGMMTAALEPSTEYLFGITATGGAGMYSA